MVRDPARFQPFAAALRKDVESVLADYDIPDKATLRGLMGQLMLLDYLDGRWEAALARTSSARALQEKPADKLLSGLRLIGMARAALATGQREGPAFQKAVADNLMQALEPLRFQVFANEVREFKSSAEVIGEALVLGQVREVLQPIATRTGELSSDFAPAIVNVRYGLIASLLLKAVFVDVFTRYLQARTVAKADIWAARAVALDAAQPYTPVRIAVWDTGVDTTLFRAQLLAGPGGQPVAIAFDKHAKPSKSLLAPLTPDVRKRLPEMGARTKGFSDLQSNIDSPEAIEVKKWLSGLPPAAYKLAVEEMGMIGNFQHGTHVAGIALEGNSFARLVVARLEFDYCLQPEPCPSRGQALAEAFQDAPEILFAAAAGNSGNDPGFVEHIPASIVLPNMLTVGAVDLAGDEASFTSYGPMVRVHANGYQVESFLPGGQRVALSGTSMAAPAVANLAAKLLAVKPALTPPELVKLITGTAEPTADGRRFLMHPTKALEAVLK